MNSMTEDESDEDMEMDSRYTPLLKSIEMGDITAVFLESIE